MRVLLDGDPVRTRERQGAGRRGGRSRQYALPTTLGRDGECFDFAHLRFGGAPGHGLPNCRCCWQFGALLDLQFRFDGTVE